MQVRLPSRILVFARAPVAGQVKTRLIDRLGKQQATSLYISMLECALQAACSVPGAETELWCTPDENHDYFQSCRKRFGVNTFRQRGMDLGERMSNAIAYAADNGRATLLIGSDCPAYSSKYLHNALKLLKDNRDIVLGPASDGGYVLIGVKQHYAELFSRIPWGSNRVCELTREKATVLGLNCRELNQLHDVDLPEDLDHYPQLKRIHGR